MRCVVLGVKYELKDELSLCWQLYADTIFQHTGKARIHIVHPSFFILQLTESVEISEVMEEQLMCTMCLLAFSSFTAEISELKDE